MSHHWHVRVCVCVCVCAHAYKCPRARIHTCACVCVCPSVCLPAYARVPRSVFVFLRYWPPALFKT